MPVITDTDDARSEPTAQPPAPPSTAPESLGGIGAAALLSLATLTACGGGGGGEPPAPPAPTPPAPAPPAPTPPAPPAPPTEQQAARFLAQASFAVTDADLTAVQAKGMSAWLDEQFAVPQQAGTRYQWMVDNGFAIGSNISSLAGLDSALWARLIGGKDPVRQRMALALSEIVVVSMLGVSVSFRALAVAHYADLLEKHAFGNYRDLLQDMTLSAAMGSYLNMEGNRKEDPSSGLVPDENFARELMQLFTIGLVQLNIDGSVKTQSGKPLETYTQTDITQLARVFTGWVFDRTPLPISLDVAFATRPMRNDSSFYQPGNKTVLGATIPGTATAAEAMGQVLDLLFRHPNVGPFIGRQLIQRFTSSNPSPAYVTRVATVFNDNGSGVRGDLKAVLRAVLLDSEARATPSGVSGANGGRLREPMLRFIQWARTFGVTSKSGHWGIGNLSDPATALGQSPMRSTSVFNFFRPGYVPPGGELAVNNITAPEFQLVNESTVAGYLNYMQNVIANGIGNGDMVPDYSAELAVANDAAALLQRLNVRLAGGGLSSATLASLTTAVSSIAATSDANRLSRVRAAVLLVMAAPEYLVQR